MAIRLMPLPLNAAYLDGTAQIVRMRSPYNVLRQRDATKAVLNTKWLDKVLKAVPQVAISGKLVSEWENVKKRKGN